MIALLGGAFLIFMLLSSFHSFPRGIYLRVTDLGHLQNVPYNVFLNNQILSSLTKVTYKKKKIHVQYLLAGYEWWLYTRFDGESKYSELRMVNISDRRGLSLPKSLPHCFVDKESSSYIGCNGSEVPFRSNLFSIQKLIDQDIPFVLKVINPLYFAC